MTTDTGGSKREALLLQLLLGVGILANLAFLAINFSPERPHLAARRHMKVLLRANADLASWIKKTQIDEFAALNDLELELVRVDSHEEVVKALEAEEKSPTGLLAATVSDELSDDVRAKNLVRPIDGTAPKAEIDALFEEFLPSSTRVARDDKGTTWFLPRRAEMTISVYLTDAVEQAYLHWDEDRAAIDAALKEANGTGLPKGFSLEKEPGDWDSYDLFVAAWYWAHHPAPWADPMHPKSERTTPQPRMAWRTGRHDDAVYDLLGLFYRHGLTDQTLGTLDSPAIVDALQWEALFRKHHLLIPECEKPEGITEDQLNEIFRQGRLGWAPMDQEDSLTLHGGARREAPEGIELADRLDWAPMPKGMSVELKDGEPARVGHSFAFEEVELWGVPKHTPDAALAFEWIRFSTRRAMMQRETESHGMMPVRRDLQENYSVLFRVEWMQQVLDGSFDQQRAGSAKMPDAVDEKHIGEQYAMARERVLAASPPPIDLATIRARVTEVGHE
jgi:hypothetical protein